MKLEMAVCDSPLGPMTLVAGPAGVCRLEFGGPEEIEPGLVRRFGQVELVAAADPAGGVRALGRYFAGELAALDTLPVDTGGTPFQAAVWKALRRIPVGRTWSYSELAAEVGRPAAVRAVGAANGKNPVPLILPCHRVIGLDGRLVGYGGGLDRKQWLLRHEGARFVRQPSQLELAVQPVG